MLLRIAITFRGSVSAKTQASELWWRRVQDLTAADPGSSAWRRRHKAYATRRGTRPRGHLSALSASRSDRAQEGRGCQESRVPFVHWCRARLGALAPTMCLSIMPHAGAGAGGLNEDCPSRLGVHGPAWAAHGPVSISGEQPSSRREASFGCKLDEFGKRGGLRLVSQLGWTSVQQVEQGGKSEAWLCDHPAFGCCLDRCGPQYHAVVIWRQSS